MPKTIATLSAALIVSSPAFAHPDHFTGTAPSLSHLFLDPYHLALAVGAVALSLMVRRLWLRSQIVARRVD